MIKFTHRLFALFCLAGLLTLPTNVPARDIRQENRDYRVIGQTYKIGLYPETITKIKEFIKNNPQSDRLKKVLALLVEASQQSGSLEKEMKYLLVLEDSFDDTLLRNHVRYAQADILFRQKEFSLAMDLLSDVLLQTPRKSSEYAHINFLYGLCLYYAGFYEKASMVFSSLQSDSEYGHKSVLFLSDCLLETGKIELAEKLVNGFISHNSKSYYYPLALFLAGKINYIQGRTMDAQIGFEKAIEADEDENFKEKIFFDLAALYRKHKKYDQSNVEIDKLLTRFPKTGFGSKAVQLKIRNLADSGDNEQAWMLAEQSIGKYAKIDDCDMLFLAGQAKENVKNYAGAIENYSRIIDIYPGYPMIDECCYRIGYCLMQQHKYAEAVDFLISKIGSVSDTDMKRIFSRTIADSYLFLGDFAQSAKYYKETVSYCRNVEDEEQVKLLAGQAYYHAKDWQNALETWNELTRSATNPAMRANARYNTGWVYFRKSEFDFALKQYKRVMTQNDALEFKVKAIFQIANIYFLQGKYDLSLKYYYKIVRLFPGTDRKITEFALYRCGYCYRKQGNFGAADRMFRQLLKKFPESSFSPQIRFSLGCAYYNKSLFPQAAKQFAEIIRDFPQSDFINDSIFWAAKCAVNMADYALAENYLTVLLEKDRSFNYELEARLLLSSIYRKQGQFTKATNLLRQIRPAYDNGHEAIQLELELGQVAYESGNWDDAIKCFENIGSDAAEGTLAKAKYKIAQSYEKKGMEQVALQNYLDVLYGYTKHTKSALDAGFAAGAILEKQKRYKQALEIYNFIIKNFKSGIERAGRKILALGRS